MHQRHHRAVLRRRAGRLRLPLRLAGVADRLPAAAAAHAEGRLLRDPSRARAGQAAPRALPDRVDVRGLRRPAGASAAGELLGPREPDRPARRLRRGQALRRGADDGLPPPAGRGHRRSCGSSTPTARACARTTGARSRRSCARRCRTGRSRCSATARRRARSAYVSDLIDGIIRLAESGLHQPVNIGNPNEFTLLELAQRGDRGHRARARRSSTRRSRPTIRRSASPTSRWPARSSAGNRRSSCAKGSRARWRNPAPKRSPAQAPDQTPSRAAGRPPERRIRAQTSNRDTNGSQLR